MAGKFLKPDDIEWREERPDFNTEAATHFVYNPFRSQTIDSQRQRLPIFHNRSHILYLLEKHQTLILVGETGSGKSTQVPQYLIEAGWACDGTMVAVTQPRRIAATSLASRVAEECGSVLGQTVGYSIRFDERVTPGKTRLKYMTEGILLREMLMDPLLKHYCVIMVDEVHERSLNTDILLALLKKIIRKRPDLRLIISSATLDAEELRTFFDLTKREKKDLPADSFKAGSYKPGTAAIMSVTGRCFPVQVYYSQEPVPDYVAASVETAMKIANNEPPKSGDVLVFLTGHEEVDRAVRLLNEHARNMIDSDRRDRLMILPMHGSLPNEDQLKVFQRTPLGTRKVIVATNVAEASVTIPGIVYVIDCGFVKLRWYNPDTQTDALIVVPVSQASAMQRAGRAGRMRAGKVYRLYTEEDFHQLSPYTPPEVQRTNLSPAVLQLKALGIDNILRFDFPSPPPARHLSAALELLYALKALNDEGKLTDPLGMKMAEFPVEPMFAKMLLTSGEFGCSLEIATIVALMQVQNIFYYPTRGHEAIKARVARRRFEAAEGDLITYLNVATAYDKFLDNERWCSQNYINKKALKRALTLRDQLLKLMKRLGVHLMSCNRNVTAVLRCIASSLFPNTAYLHVSGDYRTVLADIVLHVHPHSVLYTEQKPSWVVFGEVLHTTQLFMRDITAIEAEWLEELAPHYFHKVTEA